MLILGSDPSDSHRNLYLTLTLQAKRMHSSRMRTIRNSSRLLGGCLVLGGVPAPGGVPGPGGCLLRGGDWCWGVVSQHALRQTPPVNRMTDRCKNITFATSLRTVNISQTACDTQSSFASYEVIQEFSQER